MDLLARTIQRELLKDTTLVPTEVSAPPEPNLAIVPVVPAHAPTFLKTINGWTLKLKKKMAKAKCVRFDRLLG